MDIITYKRAHLILEDTMLKRCQTWGHISNGRRERPMQNQDTWQNNGLICTVLLVLMIKQIFWQKEYYWKLQEGLVAATSH